MTEHNMHDPMQSSYKPHHSTETALVRLNNDIFTSLDEQKSVLLVALDLSAAFDTVDHSILLQRLEKRIGVKGTCLEWFRSYLTGRTQSVCIKESLSRPRVLDCGVPQGSVLGPKLFNIYSLPLGDIVRRHNFEYQIYADENTIYLSFKDCELKDTLDRLQDLLNDISAWMVTNMLKKMMIKLR